MSHITLAQQGLAAAEARNWDDAVTKLSEALKISANPGWLIARSKALVNLRRFREALGDADLAWHTAYQRNKRPLMVDAQYRRAVAYFRMQEYANADSCCLYAMRLIKGFPAVEKDDPKREHTDADGFWTATLDEAREEAQTDEVNQAKGGGIALAMGSAPVAQAKEWRAASTLRMQILGAMQRLPADDPARKVTTSLKPQEKKLSDVKVETKKSEAESSQSSAPAAAPKPQPAAKPAVPSDTPVRLQEFQDDSTMSVSVFSKGVKKDKLQVEMLPFAVHLDPIFWPSGDEKGFQLDLWGEIDPTASTYTVTPSKVELNLRKKLPGKWPQLKGEAKGRDSVETSPAVSKEQEELEFMKQARKKAMESTPAATTSDTKPPATAPPPTDKGKAPEPSSGPAYPSSSRSGPKDWDSLAEDVSDTEEGQDVNFFFKKLFKNATPEQQRAMMKSFTESSGTSLSTDWDDVKGRTVDAVPPEGVEAKKWK